MQIKYYPSLRRFQVEFLLRLLFSSALKDLSAAVPMGRRILGYAYFRQHLVSQYWLCSCSSA